MGRSDKHADFKHYVIDEKTGKLVVPNGTMGDRWDRKAKWNLKEEDSDTGEAIMPQLSVLSSRDDVVEIELPYFGNEREHRTLLRAVPAKKIKTAKGEVLVTTVYDLTLANYAIDRALAAKRPAPMRTMFPIRRNGRKNTPASPWKRSSIPPGNSRTTA